MVLCGIATANNEDNIDVLTYACSCCEYGQNIPCYGLVETTVYNCGIGHNKCDVAPPSEGI